MKSLPALAAVLLVFAAIAACRDEAPARSKERLDASSESHVVPVSKIPLQHRAVSGASRDGSQWERLNPPVTSGLLTGAAVGRSGLIVVTADSEVFLAAPTPSGWRALPGPVLSKPIVAVAVDSSGPADAIVVLDREGRVSLTEDSGANWRVVRDRPTSLPDTNDPASGIPPPPYEAIALRRVEGRLVILAVGGQMRRLTSRNAGASWTLDQSHKSYTLRAAEIGLDGTLAAAGDKGHVFRLEPGLLDWTDLNTGDKASWRAVTILPESGGHLAVGGLGGAFATYFKGSWRRSDISGSGDIVDLLASASSFWAVTLEGAILTKRRGRDKPWARRRVPDHRSLESILRDGDRLFAVGPEVVLHSSDGGSTWTTWRGELTQPLRGGVAFDRERAFFVGDAGTRIVLGPRGVESHPIEVAGHEVIADLTSVAFAGGKFGWITAADGSVFATQNAGLTFSRTQPLGAGVGVTSSVALDPLNIFVAGRLGRVAASGDRGRTWRRVSLPSTEQGAVAGREVLALAVASRGGEPSLLVGADRGAIFWGAGAANFRRLDPSGLSGVTAIAVRGERAWFLDRSGVLLRGASGGKHPEVLAMSAGVSLHSVVFGGEVGLALSGGGLLLRSSDRGQTWRCVDYGAEPGMYDLVHVADGRIFVMVGHRGAIVRSKDAGLTWTPVNQAPGPALDAIVSTGDALLAAGFSGALLSSTDRGQTWRRWRDAPQHLREADISALAVDGSRVAIGIPGSVLISRDDGTWETIVEPRLVAPRRILLGPGASLMVVSSFGELWYRSQLGGLEEFPAVDPSPIHLRPDARAPRILDVAMSPSSPSSGLVLTSAGVLSFDLSPASPRWKVAEPPRKTRAPGGRLAMDGDRIWLVGPGGLWASDDFGRSWVAPIAITSSHPVAVVFATPNIGFMATSAGELYATQDGGLTWEREDVGTTTRVTGLYLGLDGSVWGTGLGGLILRRRTMAVDSATSIE